MRYKDDAIFESMDSKEALEFTGGYDQEKIKHMREVKNNQKKSNTQPHTEPNKERYSTNPKPILTEYEKQILRFSNSESKGAWDKFVKDNKTMAQPKKKIEPYYMQNINGGIDDVNNPRGPITKKFDNKKISALDYIEKVKSSHNKPGPSIQQQVINYSPKKIVDVEKTLEKYEDDYVSKRGDQTIALTNTANKLKGAANKNDYILKEDRNGLMVNKNRTIAVRDSFVAKQFNNALGVEPEATPEQFGKLAERLEKDRQMRGEPTNVQRFEKNFKNINSKKPIIKKPIKRSVPIEPVKINFDDYKPFVMPFRIEEDPRSKIMEARFKEIQKQTHDEKIKRETSGLAGLIGSGKKFI